MVWKSNQERKYVSKSGCVSIIFQQGWVNHACEGKLPYRKHFVGVMKENEFILSTIQKINNINKIVLL